MNSSLGYNRNWFVSIQGSGIIISESILYLVDLFETTGFLNFKNTKNRIGPMG
jgi:hypothetical protein